MRKDVDILFVIDNSAGTLEKQRNLSKSFPALIDALRSPRLGGEIPNLHVGLVSTDLGAGDYNLPGCEVAGGDGGKLLAQPRITGCVPPSQPFIAYVEGVTNIKGPTQDPIQQVKEAFQCIAADLGTGGCGFEHPLEAARRALDPKLGLNPGFVRDGALLAVLFLTDEDDCSAKKPELFDPSQNGLTDQLGPLTSFRCFEFGIQCDVNDRTKPGPRKDCKPAYDWLYKVEDYDVFFRRLKPTGQVVMAAIAGPAEPVEVKLDAQNPSPMLGPSCQKAMGMATPAIRIKALVDSLDQGGRFNLDQQGLFNRGLDPTLTQQVPVDACSADYGPALRMLGRAIVAALDGQCIQQPLLTRGGEVVCRAGDWIGSGVTCQHSCLEQADCLVQILTPDDPNPIIDVPRCDPAKFASPDDTDCGATCPCWRIVPAPGTCLVAGTPYRLEVLPWPSSSPGSMVVTYCRQSDHPWGSTELAALPQCH